MHGRTGQSRLQQSSEEPHTVPPVMLKNSEFKIPLRARVINWGGTTHTHKRREKERKNRNRTFDKFPTRSVCAALLLMKFHLNFIYFTHRVSIRGRSLLFFLVLPPQRHTVTITTTWTRTHVVLYTKHSSGGGGVEGTAQLAVLSLGSAALATQSPLASSAPRWPIHSFASFSSPFY